MDKICLLITVFNRAAQLNRSLERLTRITLPDEVLIVDDGSTDNCEQTVRNFEGRLPIRYIYNHNPTWSICSMARNIGIKNTDCEIIITSEPEILFVTDVVKQMTDKHQEGTNQVISAGTIYHMGDNMSLHNDMINDPQERLKQEKVINSRDGSPYTPDGYLKIEGWVAPFTALYRKEWLVDIGGWDEEFTGQWGFDDTDLLTRLNRCQRGIGQNRALDIHVIHQTHATLPTQIKGNGSVENERRFLSKNMNWNEGNNDIVANKNKDWGTIKNK